MKSAKAEQALKAYLIRNCKFYLARGSGRKVRFISK